MKIKLLLSLGVLTLGMAALADQVVKFPVSGVGDAAMATHDYSYTTSPANYAKFGVFYGTAKKGGKRACDIGGTTNDRESCTISAGRNVEGNPGVGNKRLSAQAEGSLSEFSQELDDPNVLSDGYHGFYDADRYSPSAGRGTACRAKFDVYVAGSAGQGGNCPSATEFDCQNACDGANLKRGNKYDCYGACLVGCGVQAAPSSGDPCPPVIYKN